jgi:hypothetical protein
MGAAGLPRSNVTIKNGTITGFYGGIWLYRISNVLIENVRIEGNPAQQSTGVALLDPRSPSVIKNNQMNAVAIGVSIRNAVSTVIEGNSIEIQGNYPSGNAGITVDGVSSGSWIRNNRMSNVTGQFGSGISVNNNSFNVFASDNVVSSVNYGAALGNISNKYRNNVVSGANVPYVGGTDLGGNR